MRTGFSTLALVAAVCFICEGVPAFAKASFVVFDAPGADTSTSGAGTFASTIDTAGNVSGVYVGPNPPDVHGYIRLQNGTFVSYSQEQGGEMASEVAAPSGEIAGTYYGGVSGMRGFRATLDGNASFFDVPKADEGLLVTGLNTWDVALGFYYDANFVVHGFLAAAFNGPVTPFDVPGAGTAEDTGTFAWSVNSKTWIAGYYKGNNMVRHGFLHRYSPTAKDKTFDVDEAGTGPGQGTSAICINEKDVVGGSYIDSSGARHGFLRAKDGTVTKFDAPNAGTLSGQGTYMGCINGRGQVGGYYIDSANVSHGYFRSASGRIITFDVPGAGTSAFEGTTANAINSKGNISGSFVDKAGVNHGFIRLR